MKRDSKGRFTTKGIVIPFPSIGLAINCLIILFFLLPWIFVGLKLDIYSKVYQFLRFLFFNESNCVCAEDSSKEDTPKY